MEGISTDITKRKQAEERLRASEAKHRTLVESVPQKVFMKDRNSVFVMCNENFARDLDITPDELVGKTDFDFYPRELAEKYRADDKQVMDFNETLEIEETYLQNDEKRIVQTVKAPVHDEHGNVVGIFGIFWDVTERMKSRIKMLEYQAQLQTLNAELILAEEQERRRIALDLHDGVAQTLVSLKMSVDGLKAIYHEEALAGKLWQMSEGLKHAVQDIRTLTFDLSSPTLHELGLEPALDELLTEQFQATYGIETEFQDDGRPKPLEDHLKVTLFRAVRELLMNVVKYAQARKIVIRCQREHDHIQITVVDDGVGFDIKELTTRSGSQRGLGLFSIRERLRSTGGDIRIESQPQQGTKVTLQGPLRQELVEAE